jgi:hypothetical protein
MRFSTQRRSLPITPPPPPGLFVCVVYGLHAIFFSTPLLNRRISNVQHRPPPPHLIFRKFNVFFLLLTVSLMFPALVSASQSSGNVAPDPECEQAWQGFRASEPKAEIRWGRKFGHPMIVWGFDPVESEGDFVGTMRAFLADNLALFGVQEQPAPGRVLAELVEPYAAYHCDHDRMEPLPGLRDDEWIEPSCPEGTVIVFKQQIDGEPFLDGSVIGTFDAAGRLIKVAGEFVGHTDAPLVAWIDEREAQLAVEAYVGAIPGELRFSTAKHGYRFLNGDIVPVWTMRVTASFDIEGVGRDVTAIVNAESATVLAVFSNIDGAPDDEYDEIVVGYSLDTQAAIECNEPATRARWVDSSYGDYPDRVAFNPDVHVYDMNEEDNCYVASLYSNDAESGYQSFNYRIVDIYVPGPPYHDIPLNDDNVAVRTNDISTWTTFNHALYALNYFKNTLGFNEDQYEIGPGLFVSTNYPGNHNLVVIVNKNVNNESLCGGTTPACFREHGFPVFNEDPIIVDCLVSTEYKEFLPTVLTLPNFTLDRFDEDSPSVLRPTMVLGTGDGYAWYQHTPYTDFIRHAAIYHEFTHYVQKAYKTGDEYWEADELEWNVHEARAFKEGFAKYFGASMENASAENFALSNLQCESDQYAFQYKPTSICCAGTYNAAGVLTQIFWDIRNGTSSVTGIGKLYADKLAFLTMEEAALTGAQTMTDIWDISSGIVANELAADCPFSNVISCASRVQAAFERHGVDTAAPYVYPYMTCSSLYCAAFDCPLGDAGNCPGTSTASCTVAKTITCCGENDFNSSYYDNVCTDHEAVLVNSCQLFSSEADCLDQCTQDLWLHDFREYLGTLTAGDCKKCGDVCDSIPWLDCGLFSYRFQCTWSCQLNWDLDDFRCLIENLKYPEACDVCL